MLAHRNVYKKVGYRFAEESQLQAEEKWIIDSLIKIKKQRNSLQIERLQLESIKAQLNRPSSCKAPSTVTSAELACSSQALQETDLQLMEVDTPARSREYNEVQCNLEELNLVVSKPLYRKDLEHDNSVEEDESDEDGDDVVVDMNMLMNGDLEDAF